MSVIVGLIPTREGQAALDFAAQECVLRGRDLVVVPGRDVDPDGSDSALLAGVRAQLRRAGLQITVRPGRGDQELAEDLIVAAADGAGDLIVIGLRRRTPIGKLILGSNAQRILLDAPCPVIAVKAGG